MPSVLFLNAICAYARWAGVVLTIAGESMPKCLRSLASYGNFEGESDMQLDGSCHCNAVTFAVQSAYPYPFNICYCEVCRKTAGAGGFAINLGAEFATLVATGADHIKVYRATIADDKTGEVAESLAERSFCGTCGSALWLWDPRWPDLVHPHASAIDTALPVPPERVHLMLGSKAGWVEPNVAQGDQEFDRYPAESIAAWHESLGLVR